MKKLIFTIALAFTVLVSSAQNKVDSIYLQNTPDKISNCHCFITLPKQDTIPVIAYCLVDRKSLHFSWMYMYAVSGINDQSFNFNGLVIYKRYLMADKKTPTKYKVIYSVDR